MNKFFCSDACRKADEDIIGSATNHSVYVLIECPYPWEYNALESRFFPKNLEILMSEVTRKKLSLRFLLINQNKNYRENSRKILIYEKEQSSFLNGYKKYEFDVDHPEKIAPTIHKYLAGDNLDSNTQNYQTRDILVCTHGSHDKCCAKYGNPFYTEAKKTISELGLKNTRIWKASHFGGHRFAPTIINFPDGRYYGLLDQESFQAILLQTGNIESLNRVYRGWGILPTCIQVLERELIFRHGWEWFEHKVNLLHLNINLDKTLVNTQLAVLKPDDSQYICQAKLVKDQSKTIHTKGSCDASHESEFIKYSVSNLSFKFENKTSEKVLVSSYKKVS